MIPALNKQQDNAAFINADVESRAFDYFTSCQLSADDSALRYERENALTQIDKQLRPVSQERLKQIIVRLSLHYGVILHDLSLTDYLLKLQLFPEDLLCAAYWHVVRHSKYCSMPSIAELIAFMEPELSHRKIMRHKLPLLLQQSMR